MTLYLSVLGAILILNFILINLKPSGMRPEDGSMPKHVVDTDEVN
jgi:hypothetical protein